MKRRISIILAFACLHAGLIAQDEPLLPFKTDNPPEIDGFLYDSVWSTAPSVTGFKSFIPDFGKDLDFATVVYMAYDEENLYFAYRCFDDEPEKIKASVNSRDNILNDDWVCINLDSFHDQQSLYAFYINPHGIQMDSRFAGGLEDPSVDFVWYSAGTIDDQGYIVEVQIPLKSIRFSNSEPVEMAVFFERKISRQAIHGSYPPMDAEKGYAFLTQMKPMIYYDVKHYSLFEVLPAFTYLYRNRHTEGEMLKDERSPKFSLTTKYGITSQLILDGTLNPDFSQVEADAGQVDINLRYRVFYPEKRPFFLEGHDNFNFAATQADEHDPVNTLVHTRSIVNPYAGVKLTGKIGDRLTLAALYAADRVQSDYDSVDNAMAHFPIVRMKYSLSDDSFLGAIYTGMELDNLFNRLGGLDGLLRVSKASAIQYNAVFSSNKDRQGGEIQNGYMLAAEYGHDSRNISYSFGGKSISTGFITSTGFINRTGINYFKGLLKPKFYPEKEFIQRIDLELFTRQAYDIEYELWETVDHIASWIYFSGSTYIKLKAEYATEIFRAERFKTGGFHSLVSTQIGKRINLAGLYQHLGAIFYSAEPYQGVTNNFVFMGEYKPSEKLHLDLTFRYSDFNDGITGDQVYDYSILRGKITYQMNKYFFLRVIGEYNSYREELLTDFLASFTYIPGTVVYLGYGSLYERTKWEDGRYIRDERFLETTRGFFFKCSYLFRF
ncbi:MAG: carbohydrate binding family 9 domain-containing protein [Bacteroidales bacterium]|nr:carbohydrate binding family 9 domain-containing protein [Bacteroidales bacterium]